MTSGRAAAAVALGLFVLCLLFGGGSEAVAAPIQLNFVAMVTVPGAGGPYPGTLVSGSLSFDPDTLTASSTPGFYVFSSGPAVLQMPDVPLAYGLLNFVSIVDGPAGDSWVAQTETPANSPGYLDAHFALSDSTGTAISSTDYFTPDSLAPWTSGSVILTFYPRGQSPINVGQFTITELSVAAPEPTSAAAVTLALCLLGARRAFAR